MSNKLHKEYASIKATKALLKLNPEISVDQVKGYDRRARTSPFIMEHVKIIQSLTDDNESLRAQVVALQASEAKLMDEIDKLRDEASGEGGDDLVYENEKLKEEIDDLKYDMENDLYTEQQIEVLREEWIGCENKALRKEIIDCKRDHRLATERRVLTDKLTKLYEIQNAELTAENRKLKWQATD
tara:strand:- start:2092 stop:2646 length:555 start_codon:yes stop_codon:yes gene_type:complete